MESQLELWCRVATRQLIFGAGCLLFWAPSGFAQQDPFSATSDAPAAENPLDAVDPNLAPTSVEIVPTETAAESSTKAPEIVEPLVIALRERPPRTPKEMARAFQWMSKLKHWSEVGNLLKLVEQNGWSNEQLADLAREGGAGLWIRLGGQDELTSEQKTQLSNIMAAPSRLARDPAWIERGIDQLASSSPSHRRYAQMRLHDSGMAAVERMVERLLEGESKVAPLTLVSTIVQFGDDGLGALRAACFANDPDRVMRVLAAMAQWKTNEFSPEIAAGMVGLGLNGAQHSQLSNDVMKIRGRVPNHTEIRSFLADQFLKQLAVYQRARVEKRGITDFVWRPSQDEAGIVGVEGAFEQRSLERLAQLAAHRLYCENSTQQDLVEATVVLLQRAYQVSPGVLPAVAAEGHADSANTVPGLLVSLPVDVRRDFGLWQKVISQSESWQMHGAAIRAVEIIGRGIQLENGMIASGLESLSESLKDARPAIRYVSFEAISNIDPKSQYWGADRQLRLAIEMSRLASGPTVLVLGLREAFRGAAIQQLEALGAKVLATNSLAEALQYLDQPNPIESIMIVDRLAEHSLSSVIQRLRNSRRGSSLPIAVLTNDLDDVERSRIDSAGTVTSVLTRDPANMTRILTSLQGQLDTRALTEQERVRFASSAMAFVARIAANPKQYHFYPLREVNQELAGNTQVSVELQRSLLSAVGSSENQERLMRMAADRAQEAHHRLGAAQAFKQSVRQFGVRMGRSAVGAAYELYNEQGPVDPVAVQAIGVILDSLEAGAGYKNWSDIE